MKKDALKKYKDPLDSFIEDLSEGFNEFGVGLNKVFENAFEYPYYKTVKSVGHVNLSGDEKEYKVEVAAPGFTKEELNIELNNNILTIKGEHAVETKEEKKNYTRREFSKNSFDRSFRVPSNVTGEVEAKFENGVLTVGLKKKELPPKEEPKRIEIK
jgi:HSP20 family protein